MRFWHKYNPSVPSHQRSKYLDLVVAAVFFCGETRGVNKQNTGFCRNSPQKRGWKELQFGFNVDFESFEIGGTFWNEVPLNWVLVFFWENMEGDVLWFVNCRDFFWIKIRMEDSCGQRPWFLMISYWTLTCFKNKRDHSANHVHFYRVLLKGFGFWWNGVFIQGSFNYLCLGDQTMQMHGEFKGFSFNSVLFGLVISWPLLFRFI